MSKSELRRFIHDANRSDEMKAKLSTAGPEQILQIAQSYGFNFSDEIKGRFINRWYGVYFCPDREEVDQLCPCLKPNGFPTLAHYSQSTCNVEMQQEEKNFRSGEKYFRWVSKGNQMSWLTAQGILRECHQARCSRASERSNWWSFHLGEWQQ